MRKFFLPLEFLEWKQLHVDYMCGKIQVQKTHTRNDVPNLPTGEVVRNKEENCLTTSIASLGSRISYFKMKFLAQEDFEVDNTCENFHVEITNTQP